MGCIEKQARKIEASYIWKNIDTLQPSIDYVLLKN